MVWILAEKIHDNRFLRLIRNMLRAGYLEDWEWNATLSGAPQGGVASPVLSNIYLDRLDKFAETVLIPEYTRGESRKANPAYDQGGQSDGGRPAARRPRRGAGTAPAAAGPARPGIPVIPATGRLHYIRYADDHLLGFTGPEGRSRADQAPPGSVPA